MQQVRLKGIKKNRHDRERIVIYWELGKRLPSTNPEIKDSGISKSRMPTPFKKTVVDKGKLTRQIIFKAVSMDQMREREREGERERGGELLSETM